MNVIVAENLEKHYEFGNVYALKGINLTFEDGKFYIIAGPSGSGKTTLLNILSGIDRPTKGRVLVDSVEIHSMKEKELRRYHLENFGIIFQFFYLVPYLTGLENVLLPMKYSRKIENPEERALKLLRLVNAEHLKDKTPSQMSGGEMQRIAIARALANKPKYLFADEPTANLDWENKLRIWNLLRKINGEEGVTIIASTHEREFFRFADVLILLRDGEVHEIKDNTGKA
ncbi:ABC transporter ATP-binding protein [Thermococcus barophilus]|uniref:Putative transporter protein with ATPase activity n=1 Tax=Thermococcus barophilus TaxID=55802 RepID=A0A0S1XE68_THEBA|nr:ABC transporter ATP-binding protein [Thermococcus barophilus]ALM76106.1 putative transporter protein with ATPase activity [Thermococcus barophilus]